mmetsp:Transcript_118729/g.378645  ORF Transcript_118729/g.378645 Transcript_118729/m.378645 type:complete len:205 (-) Transcript_118729:254-868(-)
MRTAECQEEVGHLDVISFGRAVQGQPPFPVCRARVRAHTQKLVADHAVAPGGRQVQSSGSVALQARARALRDKLLEARGAPREDGVHDGVVAAVGGSRQRRLARDLLRDIEICALFEQHFEHRTVSVVGIASGEHQRRRRILGVAIDVCTCFEQERDELLVAARDGDLQRPVARGAAAVRVAQAAHRGAREGGVALDRSVEERL